jgi:hypothetical protein
MSGFNWLIPKLTNIEIPQMLAAAPPAQPAEKKKKRHIQVQTEWPASSQLNGKSRARMLDKRFDEVISQLSLVVDSLAKSDSQTQLGQLGLQLEAILAGYRTVHGQVFGSTASSDSDWDILGAQVNEEQRE